MRHGLKLIAVALLVGIGMMVPLGQAAEMSEVSKETVVKYLLATVKAFRTVYVEDVMGHVKKAGIEPKEDWNENPHAIMLPFQFVKTAAIAIKGETKNVEVGLISLTPIYTSNFPKTQAEVDALNKMTANPKETVLIFGDGDQFKGIVGDFAIGQECADCHNHHPKSPKRDFKKGDLMGAIVVRLKK